MKISMKIFTVIATKISAKLFILFCLLLVFSSCESEVEIPNEAEADFTFFHFADIVGEAEIDLQNKTIYAVIEGSNEVKMDTIRANFTLTNGATAYINEEKQESGITRNDFSKTVQYTVISGKTGKKNIWTVTISKRIVPPVYNFDGIVNENTILSPAIYNITKDIEISDSVYFALEAGVVLRLEPCVRIIMHPNSKFYANGTSNLPVKFLSNSDDFGANSWSDIYIDNATAEFENCIFENSGCENRPMISLNNSSIVGVKYCNIKNVLNTGFYIDDNSMFRVFEQNKIENCGETVDGCYPIHFKNLNTTSNLSEGNTVNTSKGIFIENSHIINHINLMAQSCPFIFADNITTQNTYSTGISVFISEGTSIIMAEGKSINFGQNGTVKLNIRGTEDEPVNFYGTEQTAGFWEGINLGNMLLSGSSLEYCNVNYAGNSGNSGAIKCVGTDTTKLMIKNCSINNPNSHGIYLTSGSQAKLIDNKFLNINPPYEEIFYEP